MTGTNNSHQNADSGNNPRGQCLDDSGLRFCFAEVGALWVSTVPGPIVGTTDDTAVATHLLAFADRTPKSNEQVVVVHAAFIPMGDIQAFLLELQVAVRNLRRRWSSGQRVFTWFTRSTGLYPDLGTLLRSIEEDFISPIGSVDDSSLEGLNRRFRAHLVEFVGRDHSPGGGVRENTDDHDAGEDIGIMAAASTMRLPVVARLSCPQQPVEHTQRYVEEAKGRPTTNSSPPSAANIAGADGIESLG